MSTLQRGHGTVVSRSTLAVSMSAVSHECSDSEPYTTPQFPQNLLLQTLQPKVVPLSSADIMLGHLETHCKEEGLIIRKAQNKAI